MTVLTSVPQQRLLVTEIPGPKSKAEIQRRSEEVSGGLGMFDKEIAIKVGGYWHKSLGEDMELITRMRKYMHENKQKFLIKNLIGLKKLKLIVLGLN